MSTPQTVRTIDELRALIGQDLGAGSWLEITQERVNAFAEVTGDHQWIHVDPARAAQTPNGGTIAHGYLTLSLLPFLGQHRDGVKLELPSKMVLNYGMNRVRFVSPVKVGARIRARTGLKAMDDISAGVYQVTYSQTVEIEGAVRPALVAETLVRIYL